MQERPGVKVNPPPGVNPTWRNLGLPLLALPEWTERLTPGSREALRRLANRFTVEAFIKEGRCYPGLHIHNLLMILDSFQSDRGSIVTWEENGIDRDEEGTRKGESDSRMHATPETMLEALSIAANRQVCNESTAATTSLRAKKRRSKDTNDSSSAEKKARLRQNHI
jgi:hypothetical protein